MRQQVEREGVVPEGDVRCLPGAGDDGAHDLVAGGVAQGVDDAAVAVAALAGQGQLAVFLVELRAPVDQVVDLVGRFADHHLDDGAIAQAGAGGQRVLDVVLEAVLRRQHAGDAALGVVAVALLNVVLGDDQDVEVGRHFQGRAQARDAGADDQDVGEEVRRLLGAELNQVAVRHEISLATHRRSGRERQGGSRRRRAS